MPSRLDTQVPDPGLVEGRGPRNSGPAGEQGCLGLRCTTQLVPTLCFLHRLSCLEPETHPGGGWWRLPPG